LTNTTVSHSPLSPEEKKRILTRGLIRVILFNTIVGLVFFLSAGTTQWAQVWILLALWVCYYLYMLIWGLRKSPDMVLERAKGIQKEGKEYELNLRVILFSGNGLPYNYSKNLSGGQAERYEVTGQWRSFLQGVFTQPILEVTGASILTPPSVSH